MSETQEVAGIRRNPDGTFPAGVSGNPEGSKPMPEEMKIARKAAKEIIAEYKEKLAAALPEIEPVLVAKAIAGDISFIKELHDRAMGKADQKIDQKTEQTIIIGDSKIAAKFDEFLKQQSKES